jgi:helicase MOV-10
VRISRNVSSLLNILLIFRIVKLLNNYRSHPAIIQFPNERFYDGELKACGDPSSINSCLNLRPLVQRKYPIIFCSVEGQDAREATSPSFFNPEEVLRVKAYVQELIADTRVTPRIGKFPHLHMQTYFLNQFIEPAHIGVIAPYRAQCSKLRIALKKIAPEIKIGSVEEYQGDVSDDLLRSRFIAEVWCTQERRVIIITTVRSSRDYINYDLKFTLGFVANPRRFNGQLHPSLCRGVYLTHSCVSVSSSL